MTKRYHMKDDGTIGVCEAQPGNYPKKSPHFGSREQGEHFCEKANEREANIPNIEDLDSSWLFEEGGFSRYGEEGDALEIIKEKFDTYEEFSKVKRTDLDALRVAGAPMRLAREAFEDEMMPRVIAEAEASTPDIPEMDPRLMPGMTPQEYMEPGSREWLELRAGEGDEVRVGGSDFATLATNTNDKGFDPSLMRSKVFPGSSNYIATPYAIEYGHAMEPHLAKMAEADIRDELGRDVSVQVVKNAFVSNDDPRIIANVDGVIVDENGKPEGILEVKTGWNASNWTGEDGRMRVPDNYRAQTLYYLEATGLDYAYLTASVKGSKPVLFRMERGEKINDEVGTVRDVLDKHLDNFESSVVASRNGAPIPRTRPKKKNPLETPSGMRDLIKNTDKPVYVVDIETTGLDSWESVIEVGVIDARTGERVHSELYSPAEPIAKAYGTGAEKIHNISMDMVKDKPVFEDGGAEKLGKLLDGATVIAHNAPFEKKFIGRYAKKAEWVDTKTVAREFAPDAPSAKLKDWAEYEGVEYPKDSHRAVVDAETTLKALNKLMDRS